MVSVALSVNPIKDLYYQKNRLQKNIDIEDVHFWLNVSNWTFNFPFTVHVWAQLPQDKLDHVYQPYEQTKGNMLCTERC